MKHKFSRSRKYTKFIDHFNHFIVKLIDLWNKIGFNSSAKIKRLDNVFKTLIDTFDGIYDAEKELQENICQNIISNRFTIKKLCTELGYDCQIDDLSQTKSLYDEDRLLVEYKNRLLNEKRLDDSINELKMKCNELWLDVGAPKNYFPLETKSKSDTIECLQNEYNRCLSIKQAKLEQEIALLSKKMFIIADYNQNLSEIQVALQVKYSKYHVLYNKTQKWLELWQEFIDFEERTKDPNRFKARGFNGFEEEKQRKRFYLNLPRLEDDLRTLSNEYFSQEGIPYTIYGQLWYNFMQNIRQNYENHKKNEKLQRQRARDALMSLQTPSPIVKKRLKRWSSAATSKFIQIKRASFCINEFTSD